MASPHVTAVPYPAGNVVVVTQVVPAAPNGEQQRLSDRGQKFRKGHPKALGTVQLMIGAITLLFGIATAIYQPSLGVYSGIFVWGALFYITSGSLTVAADKSLSRCLINTSLGFNIVSAVVAGVGVILYALDPAVLYYVCVYSHNDSYSHYHHRYRFYYGGYSAVVAVFQFLELVISITSAAFACSSTGCCMEQPPVVVQMVPAPGTTQAPPHFQAASVAPPQPYPQAAPLVKNPVDMGSAQPPAYNPAY
ncbi:unnamed protein product [Ophioblennius macclurei]